MKKFLSMVLALVMVMSLVTVSAGAKDFTDDDKITYDEAVAVVSEVGIVDGYADGAFNPTNTLTRQAAAKIICNLILGPTTAAELHADTAPYRDVPVTSEFAGYIAYCQAKGIISGYADGAFRPGNTLTGYAFMKMLLGALGYDATLENYVGANWSINVAKQALGIGLAAGIEGEFNGIKAVTREEACLYAFNTLQADLVEYGQRLTTNINGTEVTLSSGGAQTREWKSQQTRVNSIRNDNIVQFAEEYFNLLVKTPDEDIFMRPAHTWVYDKKVQIGTWVDQDKLLETYTDSVSARDLYDLLGSAVIRDFDLEVYVDGHVAGEGDPTEYTGLYTPATKEISQFDNLTRSNTKTVGATGKGVLTEVYKDNDAEEIIIVSIHTWLAQGTSSYSESREAATVKVFLTNATGTTKTVNVDDVPEVVDVVSEDFYLVTMSDKDTTKLEVVEIAEPEILEESTITKFSTDSESSREYPSKLTTGGTEYKKSTTAVYDTETLDLYDDDLLANNTYNVYVDKYGYFIGVDLYEGTKQYVFVTGYDMKNSNLSYKTAEAAGIFLDGTMDTMTVNVKDTNKNILSMVYKDDNWNTPKADGVDGTNAAAYYKQWGTNASQGVYLLNRWYTYTVTESGVYTLKPCVNKDGQAMMLAAKSENRDDDGAPVAMKLNASKLRLDSVVDTDDNEGNLLVGETMKYAGNVADPTDPVLDSYRAYGEDASVFITVDVDEVSAVAAGTGEKKLEITRAITDVNGRYTGVQDVDMFTDYTDRIAGLYYDEAGDKATDADANWVAAGSGKSYLGENAYAVFDKNNFIIGAIILGEAEGNNATKAYILDPVIYERYENGTYYWQFEAVINGEIVQQEAESKYRDTITTMRNHQYEIVELRYKDADNEIVSDVKYIERKDGDAEDKIYGNQFNEIKRALNTDKESIYDVVLTGPSAGATVTFDEVTRPYAYTEHTGGKVFTKTELGYLRLQGRTLYVLDGQNDHGIDFTRDAKAVVIQPEGTETDNDLETRAYNSVQEAIDSLSDGIDPESEVKEFRGIITAVLGSNGVAEWVVFFSDTLLDTRASVNTKPNTMDVVINVKFPGSDQASYWRTIQVPGVDGQLVKISNPDILNGSPIQDGYSPKLVEIPIVWEKNAENKSVTFEYEKDLVIAGIDVTTGPTKDDGYEVGDAFDPAGMKVTITYDDGTTKEVSSAWAANGITFSPATFTSYEAATDVTVTCGTETATVSVGMAARTPSVSGTLSATTFGSTAGGTATATLTVGDGADNLDATVTPNTVGSTGVTASVATDANGVTTLTVTVAAGASADTYTVSVTFDDEAGDAATPVDFTVTVTA